MSNKKRQRYFLGLPIKEGVGEAILIVALILVFAYAVSWIISCGLIWLICLCFHLEFKWSIATGIWIIMCIIQSIFTGRNNGK